MTELELERIESGQKSVDAWPASLVDLVASLGEAVHGRAIATPS
jgi:hypothetical protein